MITRNKFGALTSRYRIAAPATRDRWFNILAGVARFVATEGWWPTARELGEYMRLTLKPATICRELRELENEHPVPLVRYTRKAWHLTDEGWKALEREPVAARYAFRPRVLPARVKRRRNGLVREAAHAVFEGRGEDTPIIE